MKRPKGGFEIALPAASVVPIKKMGSAMLPVWDLGIQQSTSQNPGRIFPVAVQHRQSFQQRKAAEASSCNGGG